MATAEGNNDMNIHEGQPVGAPQSPEGTPPTANGGLQKWKDFFNRRMGRREAIGLAVASTVASIAAAEQINNAVNTVGGALVGAVAQPLAEAAAPSKTPEARKAKDTTPPNTITFTYKGKQDTCSTDNLTPGDTKYGNQPNVPEETTYFWAGTDPNTTTATSKWQEPAANYPESQTGVKPKASLGILADTNNARLNQLIGAYRDEPQTMELFAIQRSLDDPTQYCSDQPKPVSLGIILNISAAPITQYESGVDTQAGTTQNYDLVNVNDPVDPNQKGLWKVYKNSNGQYVFPAKKVESIPPPTTTPKPGASTSVYLPALDRGHKSTPLQP